MRIRTFKSETKVLGQKWYPLWVRGGLLCCACFSGSCSLVIADTSTRNELSLNGSLQGENFSNSGETQELTLTHQKAPGEVAWTSD